MNVATSISFFKCKALVGSAIVIQEQQAMHGLVAGGRRNLNMELVDTMAPKQGTLWQFDIMLQGPISYPSATIMYVSGPFYLASDMGKVYKRYLLTHFQVHTLLCIPLFHRPLCPFMPKYLFTSCSSIAPHAPRTCNFSASTFSN